MKKKIFTFLVFLFLTINASSAALYASDVEVASEISNNAYMLDEVTDGIFKFFKLKVIQ
ncbi:MAG: hypothetical protein KO318_05005 [Methanobacterium sp.]|jgi:hypothetical protein|uniref:hypothetical protein n=1 Tax=Methanobacterium sp. TaxID=2164 RepID=UPI002586BBB1|nr:hypothetical protein [Methanobacterium sp.]MCC7559773.1 hypothetical protein [Methanobacterium sp.]